jgi:hypothetical protein
VNTHKKFILIAIICSLGFFSGVAYFGQNKIVPSTVEGSVDSLVIKGDKIRVLGWAVAKEPQNEVISISIWCADKLIYKGGFEQFERPDVAKAMKRNDWLKSGWGIGAELPSNLKCSENQIKIFAKLNSGVVEKISFQKKSLLERLKKYHISFFAEGALVVLAQLALLFYLFFAVRKFSVSEIHKEQIGAVLESEKKGEEWCFRIFFFFIALAGCKLLLMKHDGSVFINLLATIFAIICSYVLVPGPCNFYRRLTIRKDIGKNLVLIALVLFYLGWIYARGVILPNYDPIAVPTFASILNQNIPLNTYYAHVESGAVVYPPGFPLLLSFGFIFLDQIWVLVLFKILCVLAVGLIPFSWAWLVKCVFKIPLSLTTIAITFYIAGFGIERTLSYALPYAGKNAQLFLLSIFPLFFVYLIKTPYRNLLHLAVLGFSFYCLILFHYSTLYLSFLLFLSFFFVGFLSEPRKFSPIARRSLFIGVVGIIGAICFYLFSNDVIDTLRRTFSGGVHDPGSPYKLFMRILFGVDNRLLAIFNTKIYQVVGSPMRGYLLLGCVIFSAIVMLKTKNKFNEIPARSILLCSGTLYLAILMGAVFGSGVISASLDFNYYRWFILPLQIGVIACALLSAYILLRNIPKKVAIVFVVFFLTSPTWVFITDSIKIKKGVDGCAISRPQLKEMRDIIVPGSSGCGILSPNVVFTKNTTFVQKYRLLEYAEMLTRCQMLAGSWLHGPSAGWRESNSFPREDVFHSIPRGMNLYFVGTQGELDKYNKISNWKEVGILPKTEIPIWKMKSTAE